LIFQHVILDKRELSVHYIGAFCIRWVYSTCYVQLVARRRTLIYYYYIVVRPFVPIYIQYIYRRRESEMLERTRLLRLITPHIIYFRTNILIHCVVRGCAVYMYIACFRPRIHTYTCIYDDMMAIIIYYYILARKSRFAKTHRNLRIYAAISRAIGFLASRLEPRVSQGPEPEQLCGSFR